jgi:cytochrome c oxidase assembly protein subunit 15
MNNSYNCWLHRFACLLAFATFLLICAGATVTSHRAGLSVPDWPTTYGRFMFSFPISKWVGNIRYEHVHRLLASVVGMLTVVLAFWLVRKEPRRWVRWLGIAALGVVIAQGVLGGLTVKLMLPPPISIAHASLAEAFFCITIALALVTSERWREVSLDIETVNAGLIRRFALASTVAIYLQIMLGATIRHSESGVLAHIIGAVVVSGCVITSMMIALLTREQKEFVRPTLLLFSLMTMQIILGIVTLVVRVPKNVDGQLSAVQIIVPTLHLALGALILATSLSITLKTYRLLALTREEEALPFAAGVLS